MLDTPDKTGPRGADLPFGSLLRWKPHMRYNEDMTRAKSIIFFLVVGSIAGYLVFKEVTRVGKPGIINIGQQAPDFSIKDENGRAIKLSDYRGKLVFLNFWATWCGPCVEEMPELESMYKTLKARKFQMLAVSIDTDWDTVKDFYKQHNLSIPAFWIRDSRLQDFSIKLPGGPKLS